MDQQNRRRSSRRIGVGGILLRVALVLLCLVLLSVYLMKGLYARYQTTGSGSDSARVAKFDVVVSGMPSDTIQVICNNYNGDTGVYTFTVTNNSEVAVEYDAKLTYTHDVDYIKAKIDGTAVGWLDTSTQGFPNVGVLAPGADKTHTLTLTVDWDMFTKEAHGSSKSQAVGFTLTIFVEQID